MKSFIAVLGKLHQKYRNGLLMHFFTSQLAGLGLDFRPYVVMQEFFAENESLEFGPEFDKFEVAWLDREEMQALDRIDGRVQTAEDLRERLDRDNRCLGLLHEGQIVAFNWCELRQIKHEYLQVELTAEDAYVYDAHTIKAYRGQGLAPFLRYQCNQALYDMGRRTLYSFSDYFNGPALRFKEKLNARWLKLVLRVRLFKLIDTKWVVKNYAPAIKEQ